MAPVARGTLVLLPALGTPAAYYRPFAETCASQGFHVLLPELPGTGASRPRPSRRVDYGYRDLVESYLPAVIGEARTHADGFPLIVIGHSLGAHAAMLAVLQNTISIEALVTLAGGNIHYRNWSGSGPGKVRFMAWLVSGISYPLGHVPGQYLGLGGPQPRTLMREWSRIIRSGSYSHISGPLPNSAPIPALSVGYEGDFMAPRRSVAQLAGMLGGDIEWLSVDWAGNPHSSWARHPAKTFRLIDDWLAACDVVPSA